MSQTAARAADVEKMKLQMMQAMNIKDPKELQRMAREYCKDMAVELTLPAYHRLATQISRSITKNRDAFDAMSATDKVVQLMKAVMEDEEIVEGFKMAMDREDKEAMISPELSGDKRAAGNAAFQKKKDEQNPEYNEEFNFTLETLENRVLKVKVMDDDIGSDEKLGSAEIKLDEQDLQPGEMKEIEAIPKKAAQLAAEEAKKIVQGEVNEQASKVAIMKAKLAPPGLPVPLAEAAVRAAQPYYNVMQKAIAVGNMYEANAHSLQDQAEVLQQQSRTFASQAVAYQTAGYGDAAENLMARAKDLLAQAQAKDDAAKKDFSVAEGVQKQIPNYQANAAAASARATSLANPAGQPPPAMAPKSFLQTASSFRRNTRSSQ